MDLEWNSRSVFSTHVEVFPQNRTKWTLMKWSSPRTWRCFQGFLEQVLKLQVFSTHVEVFLTDRPCFLKKLGLLHVRGGVSMPDQPVAVPS